MGGIVNCISGDGTAAEATGGAGGATVGAADRETEDGGVRSGAVEASPS